MKRLSIRNILWAVGIFVAMPLVAQVSHGGHPLPLSVLRSAAANTQQFETLPAFDLQEQLRIDSLEQTDLRNGFHFAYKFMTDYTPDNSGVHFTTAEGTKVWRLGIHSAGALSLNVLFSEYELPEGAQLFLYNADQSQVLGAFNHLNNSELGLLPVAPIEGDSLIIEYQEPASAAFRGKLCVGEVNHGYRSLRGLEPNDNTSSNSTSPAVICYQDSDEQLDQLRRSVVLLIIDGTTGCTGVLLNNTAQDGRPYFLTASHCLNNLFQVKNPDYEAVAGRIVCFYQFESPFCGTLMRGTEELSTASAHYRAVDEEGDMALLELLETPPVYYQPYYAGWNITEQGGEGPFTGLHHPNYTVKRFCLTDQVEPATFDISEIKFYGKAHWHVSDWQIGYTNAGSSGSPLFNAHGEVIGALTGGNSTASNPKNDYYYRLAATWNTKTEPEHQLSHWLNPQANGQQRCEGLDPYAAAPAFRLSNVAVSGHQEEAEAAYYEKSEETPLFGNNPLGIEACAEVYQSNGAATLHGAYIVTPSCGSAYANMEVEIVVYAGDTKPTTLLHKERFKPSYTNLALTNQEFQESTKPLNRSQETFIPFSQPITVNGMFYVGYQFVQPNGAYFSAYSLPEGVSTRNTTWMKISNEWKPAPEVQSVGYSTSLFIDPVIQYGGSVANEEIVSSKELPLICQGTTKGVYHVWLPDGHEQATYQVTAINGQIIEEGWLQGATSTLRLPSMGTGIYLLTVRCGAQTQTLKIRM